MKLHFPTRALLLTPALATIARAHPGHDGHELTWDFHPHGLMDSPLAWIAVAAALGVVLHRVSRARR